MNTIKQSEPLSSVRTSCRGIGGLEESNNEVVLMVSGAMAKAKQVRDYGCSREGEEKWLLSRLLLTMNVSDLPCSGMEKPTGVSW